MTSKSFDWRDLSVILLLFGVHFLVWWAVSPIPGETPTFIGVRGVRELWVFSAIISLVAFHIRKQSPWVCAFLVWLSIVGLYQVLWFGRPYVFTYFDIMYAVILALWMVYSQRLQAKKMAYLLVLIALVNVLWVLLQFVEIDPVWRQLMSQELAWNLRPAGWLDNNSNLAHFLAMIVPLAMAMSWWLVIPIAIPILLATKTLPIIGAVLGIIVAKRWWYRGIVLCLIAATYIGVYDPPRYADTVRAVVIKHSLWLANKSPIFGFGPGSFKRYFPYYLANYPHMLGEMQVRDPATDKHHRAKRMPTHTEIFHHPSNEAVKAIFEMGWPSLVIILGWVVYIGRKAKKTAAHRWRDAYAGASVAFLITMLGYQPLAVPPLAVSGLMVWGIYEGLICRSKVKN